MVWSHAAVGTLIATLFAVVMALQFRTTFGVHVVDGWIALKIFDCHSACHPGPGLQDVADFLAALSGGRVLTGCWRSTAPFGGVQAFP